MLAYPSSAFYASRRISSPFLRSLYFLVNGLILSYFFCERDTIHGLITILVSYFTCFSVGEILGNRFYAAIGVFCFNMVYLLLGYVNTMSDGYDICWTMPQCILCLRMIGFSLDYMDGKHFVKDQADSCIPPPGPIAFPETSPLPKLPSLIDVASYAYFPSSFLVGPQFSFDLYHRFLHNTHIPTKDITSKVLDESKWKYLISCLSKGVFYLVLTLLLQQIIWTEYVLSDEFVSLPLSIRCFWMWLAGRAVINKV